MTRADFNRYREKKIYYLVVEVTTSNATSALAEADKFVDWLCKLIPDEAIENIDEKELMK